MRDSEPTKPDLLETDPDRDTVIVANNRTGETMQAKVDDSGIVRTNDQQGAAFSAAAYTLRDTDA